MRILVVNAQVPFTRGGAEILADELIAALRECGHEAELVQIPFKWYPPRRIPEQILGCRLLDLTEFAGLSVDRLIALKFPAYFVPHPNKVLWMLHQHRAAYDLWNTEHTDLVHFADGRAVRDIVESSDRRLIPEARAVYTISRNVSKRLKQYCEIDSTPLYHPPKSSTLFHCREAEPFFFFPSRINPIKRQELVVKALAHTRRPVRVLFAGRFGSEAIQSHIEAIVEHHGVNDRCAWLGEISEEAKVDTYARCLGVVYPPIDEDYGYITLEAMLSAKPVITCDDSGGSLEFVVDGQTGLVAEPTAQALAEAMDALWDDRERARKLGDAGRALYDSREISWPKVVETLLA